MNSFCAKRSCFPRAATASTTSYDHKVLFNKSGPQPNPRPALFLNHPAWNIYIYTAFFSALPSLIPFCHTCSFFPPFFYFSQTRYPPSLPSTTTTTTSSQHTHSHSYPRSFPGVHTSPSFFFRQSEYLTYLLEKPSSAQRQITLHHNPLSVCFSSLRSRGRGLAKERNGNSKPRHDTTTKSEHYIHPIAFQGPLSFLSFYQSGKATKK